jgi:hypothetical protein
MIISCVKWGDKFSSDHVNRLYDMCRGNYSNRFQFICHTDDPTGLYPVIKVRELDQSHDLENWWWKLTLFDDHSWPTGKYGKHLFFDLDVVIQDNIDHLEQYTSHKKLTMIEAFWKDYVLKDLDMNYNSSIMAWEGDCSYLWRKFNKDPEYYKLKYNGIDGFLYYECFSELKTFPRGIAYSRLFGIDESNNFKPINGNVPSRYFFDESYPVCIFNGWRREKYDDGTYWLDDDSYEGLKHYWNKLKSWKMSDPSEYTGITKNVWKAAWRCAQTGGDIIHFLDSLSDNQFKSKMWLVTELDKHITHPYSVQLYGGWFAHPISSLLTTVFPNLKKIKNIDLDDNALHYSRLINNDVEILTTVHQDVSEPCDDDWDTDIVINTSSEHMLPLPELIKNKKYRTLADDTIAGPCLFAIQSNNMFHVSDHINCVNDEDELADMCNFTKLLYKGSLNMPNGYKRFMVIGYV